MCFPAVAATLPEGFVRLADIAPSIMQDIRYAGPNNFTGKPVPGYGAAQCWLRQDAALALIAAQTEARSRGFDLVVYDCYRPRRAVTAFIDWSKSDDDGAKADYYPRLDKRALIPQGYISEHSAHCTGLAVDLGVVGWDFGAPFDYFDELSWTNATVAKTAHEARRTLLDLMTRHGFKSFPREWWHFTFADPSAAPSYDTPIE